MSKVVRINKAVPGSQELPSKKGPEARWGTRLGQSFTPVSSFFLHNSHRLKPEGLPHAKGLSPAEVMVLIHLMDHQWDERFSFPSLGTIATRMCLTRRQVRDYVRGLEQLNLLKRIAGARGSTNRYDLRPLLKRLEALMEEDIAAQDQAELAELAASTEEVK